MLYEHKREIFYRAFSCLDAVLNSMMATLLRPRKVYNHRYDRKCTRKCLSTHLVNGGLVLPDYLPKM